MADKRAAREFIEVIIESYERKINNLHKIVRVSGSRDALERIKFFKSEIDFYKTQLETL